MPISYTRRSPVLLLDTLQRNCASSYLGLDPLSAVDLVEAEDLVVDSVAEDLMEDLVEDLEVVDSVAEDLEVDLEVVDSVAEDLVAVDSVVEDLVGDLAMEDSVVLLVEKVAGVMGVEKTYPFWTP